MVFYLTLDEVERILNTAQSQLNSAVTEKQVEKALRNYILVRILYWGWRISEVVGDKKNKLPGIYLEHIDFDATNITLVQKGKKDLVRIVDSETLNLIRLYCKMKGIKKGPLLPMHRTTAWRVIKRLAMDANLVRAKQISCHPYGRHTFAIHAANQTHLFMEKGGKFNLALVQEQLGHADIETTIRFYTPYIAVDRLKAAFAVT